MENITRTAYGSFLQNCLLEGLPFTLLANTTLNEKFGIQSGVAPDIADIPKMRYYAIGNGGHRMTVGANNLAKPDPIQHRTTDAALFNHLPFVLREPANDLDPATRANYALRCQETHGGVIYIAYYLKRIDMSQVVPAIEYNAVSNGVTTTTPFVPTSDNLNPQPPDLNSSGVNVTTGDYITTTAKLDISLSAFDVTELLNVANILYQDPGFAIVSEIAMVSAIDRVVTSPGVGNTTINFNDVIAAQVVSFMNTFQALEFQTNGVQLLVDVGATEPLFKLQ